MHIVFPTTPAQYFHLLRRQIQRNYRKPLIVAGPKALLRLSAAASTMEDFEPGTKFKPVLVDPMQNADTAKRVALLSGKFYYDLVKERESRGLTQDIALVRVEELSPFPFSELAQVLKQYENASEVVWVQEEPRNQGAWPHVSQRIREVMRLAGRDGAEKVEYVGRKESAVPAPGYGKLFKKQQEEILESVFRGL
jgi:probable 2-oxoglutarate dehydrogenase E1 component DHKTD1